MLGALVVAAGVLAILAAAGVDIPWAIALAVGAGAVGVAVIAGAFLRLRVGWLIVIGALLGAAAILASTINLKLEDGVGDRSYAPATIAAIDDPYKLGIGELDLDLSNLALEPGDHPDRRPASASGTCSSPCRPASRCTSRATSTGATASCSGTTTTATTSTTRSTGRQRANAPCWSSTSRSAPARCR